MECSSKLTLSNIPSDYPLPNLYYFSSKFLTEIRKQVTGAVSILNQNGFEECHFPFLVPRSLLLYYKNLISLEDFIKVYSGKDKRSYAYLRPDGVFSQGITLAKEMIKSYRNLPLKLFEVSPSYKRLKNKTKGNVFTSPEESFSIQGGVFIEDKDENEFLQTIISRILNNFSIPYIAKNNKLCKYGGINYSTLFSDNEINLAKICVFDQEVTREANIYFFNKEGRRSFPYMYSFSLSQNIFLISLLKNERIGLEK